MNDWTKQENEAIVKDYFSMLLKELSFENYSKTQYRNELIQKNINRSKGAIERKHMNISAILKKMGLPFINGYKPYANYQLPLYDEITSFLKKEREVLSKIEDFVQAKVSFKNDDIDYSKALLNIEQEIKGDQKIKSKIEEKIIPYKVNFLEREQANRALGYEGEKFVFNYERWRLSESGKYSLAKKVEWVSIEKGDGLGYDILSKNNDGTDRHIEVKTTKLGMYTPIFLSQNENQFSKSNSSSYYLYRVFDFRKKPKLYIKSGEIENSFILEASSFKGELM